MRPKATALLWLQLRRTEPVAAAPRFGRMAVRTIPARPSPKLRGVRRMARPVTLFTGQWADLPLETMARKTAEFGYNGIELACWGDHFEVDKANKDASYCRKKRDVLERNDLQVFAISAHLV